MLSAALTRCWRLQSKCDRGNKDPQCKTALNLLGEIPEEHLTGMGWYMVAMIQKTQFDAVEVAAGFMEVRCRHEGLQH